MSDLHAVYGRNYNVCDRLRQRKRLFTVVYGRRNVRHGSVKV
jgi:hypothetical protein